MINLVNKNKINMACTHTLKLDREYQFNSREELDAVLEGIDVNEIIKNPSKFRIENGKIVENTVNSKLTSILNNSVIEHQSDKSLRTINIAQQEGLEINKEYSSHELLQLITKYDLTPLEKAIVKRFMSYKAVPVTIHNTLQSKQSGMSINGGSTLNGISLNNIQTEIQFKSVLIHELTHIYTRQSISNPTIEQIGNVKELQKIFNYFKMFNDGQYGFTSIEEFIAEMYSNNEFRTYLDSIKVSKAEIDNIKPNTSLLQWLKNTLSMLIGIEKSMLDYALVVSKRLELDNISANPNHLETINTYYNTNKFDLKYYDDKGLNYKTGYKIPFDVLTKYRDSGILEYINQTNLTPEQKQNIQELKQLEPAYSQASDEKVQEFIGNQYQRITTQLELSDLPTNQKANAEHLLHSFINLLKNKFPNIKFNVDYFNRSEMGWLDTEGVININLNKVSLSTPFHELAHIVVALIKDSDSNTYGKLKEAVLSLDGLIESVRKQYPELNEELQIEEAIVTLIGELAVKKKIDESVKRNWSNITLNRVKEWLIKSVNKILGTNFNYKSSKENPFHYTFDKFIETIVDDLTNDTTNEISSRRIAAIIKEVKYQKANAIEVANNLLTFISGRNVNTNDTGNRRQAKNIVGNISYEYENNGKLGFFTSIQAKQDFTDVRNPKGGAEEFVLYSSDDKDARIEQVLNTLRSKKSTDIDETIVLIQDYYVNFNSKEMLEKIKNTPLLYNTIKSLFPNYKVDDEIMKYEQLKDKYPQLYNPDLDNPLLLVRIGKDGSIDVVTISNESIQQTTTSGSIISELGGKKSMFEKLGNKMLTVFKSISLSNDYVNVASLHVMMVAMDLKSKGKIIDTLSVSQFKDSKSSKYYNVERVDRNKYLFNLKKILSIEVVKERIKDSELGKMFYKKDEINEQIFEAEQHTKSFLDSIMDMTLVGANNSTYTLIDKVKKYKEAVSTNTNIVDTYNELKKAIRIALANLNSTLKTDSDKVKSSEYILLSQTLFFLETNSQLSVNEYKEIGALEQWITSLKTTQNPFLNWWTKMWDDKRYMIVEKFLEYQKVRDVKYEKILQENQSGTDYVASNPNKFKNMLEGSYFKQDNLLNPNELTFKKYYIQHLKELAYLSWLNNTQYKYSEELRTKPTLTVKAEFEKWYDASVWSKGAIPLIKSTISSAIFQGKAKESLENILDRMINENPYYEEDNVDFSKIPDFMYNQSMINNYEETLNRLDVHEVDLRKISDIFTMQAYKQEFMKDLIPTYKAATILMKFTEMELGLDKEIAAREGIDEFDKGTIISRDVDLLKNTFEMLLFNRKKTIGTDTTAKYINKTLVFTSTLTTYAAVALSPLTDMKTFIQSFSRMLAQGLANIGDESLFDITQVPKLIYDFITNPGETYRKAVDIGVKLRVLNMDEFDLLVNRFHTKEKFSIFDSRNNFWLNRIGDNSIKLMIMSMLMKKDKSWDAWVYNEQTKQYEYDKSKDTRAKSIVETIEQNYLKENSGIKDKLDTSHDGDMRRVLEKRVADVVGGFTDGTKTKLGMTHAGSAITKFKTYWLNRAEKFIKGEVVNEQEFDYVDEDGKTKKMNKTDVGYLKTFQKTIAGISLYYNQPAKVWNELTLEDHKNIYRTMAYTFVVSLAFFAKEMLDSDDEKDKINSIYDSIIADMWVLDQANTALSFLKSPMTSIFYTVKLLDMMKEYIMLDIEKGNIKAFNTIGILKSVEFFTQLNPK